MKRLGSIWKKMTYSAQLAIVFILAFILTLVVIQGVSGRYLVRFLQNKIEESYQQALRQTATVLDTTLKGYKLEIDELFNNTDFVRALKALDDMTPDEEWQVKAKLDQMMDQFLMYRTGIRCISVQTVNGYSYIADRLENDLLYPKVPSLHVQYYGEITGEGTNVLKGIWMPTRFLDRRGTLEYYVFSYGKRIRDWYTNQDSGTGIVSIEVETLNSLCRDGQLNADRKINSVFLTDSDDRIIADEDKEVIGMSLEDMVQNKMAGEEQYLVFMEPIPGTDWTMHSMLSRNYVFRRLEEIQRMIWIFSLIVAVGMVLLISLISGRMTRSVRSIVDTMNQVEHGRMNVHIEAQPDGNELSQIANHFNTMMDTINGQMEQIRLSGVREKEAEIRALEAQINPHFIYNTLDSINWLAVENDQQEISMMLSRFAQILRYQIAKSNQIVSIEEELHYLEYYLFLQKARFMDSFEYVVSCQETVKKEKIHKMIFQPFIENAILHGISDLEYAGLIQVRVSEAESGFIRFTVSDNGCGMSREQVEQIFVKRINPGNSIGVLNVLERLDLYYADQYSINVDSAEGKGTIIEAVIPGL